MRSVVNVDISKMRHPNIVPFLGACVAPEFCLVTEYMEHGSLTDLLSNQSIGILFNSTCLSLSLSLLSLSPLSLSLSLCVCVCVHVCLSFNACCFLFISHQWSAEA
jgi:serine/threonine protein kinase